MKLLYCPSCNTMFSLSTVIKTCECGLVKGRYDGTIAEVNGFGLSLTISNNGLKEAFDKVTNSKHELTFPLRCFAVPHRGKYNPRSQINENLKDEG